MHCTFLSFKCVFVICNAAALTSAPVLYKQKRSSIWRIKKHTHKPKCGLHGAASAQQRNIAFEFAALQTWQVASKKNSDRKSSGLSWSSRHSPLIAPLCAMARRSELVSMHDRVHGARCHIARSRSNVKGSSSRYWFDSQKEKVRTYLNMLVFLKQSTLLSLGSYCSWMWYVLSLQPLQLSLPPPFEAYSFIVARLGLQTPRRCFFAFEIAVAVFHMSWRSIFSIALFITTPCAGGRVWRHGLRLNQQGLGTVIVKEKQRRAERSAIM